MARTKKLTAKELEAIRTREKLATSGPWESEYGFNNGGMATGFFLIPAHNSGKKVEMLVNDSEFCAKAREDVPVLIAEVDRLRSATTWSQGSGLSPEVVKAVKRLGRLLEKQAKTQQTIEAEGWTDEVYNRLRPVLTERWIEKARLHLEDTLRKEAGVVNPMVERQRALGKK